MNKLRYLVSAHELDPILVHDANYPWRMKPRFPVNLNWNPLTAKHTDNDRSALGNTMAL